MDSEMSGLVEQPWLQLMCCAVCLLRGRSFRRESPSGSEYWLVCCCWTPEINVISQTPKHVRDMFNFNTTSNPRGYLVLFVSKTPSVVWYFIMDLILPKVRGYFALFESKFAVIFICIHCLIISFKLRKFTRNLRGVFPSSNLNSYIVFH